MSKTTSQSTEIEYPDPKGNKPSLSHTEEYQRTVYSVLGLGEIECWNCLDPIGDEEELYMNATSEPDGFIHSCKQCGAEYEIRTGFKVSPLT